QAGVGLNVSHSPPCQPANRTECTNAAMPVLESLEGRSLLVLASLAVTCCLELAQLLVLALCCLMYILLRNGWMHLQQSRNVDLASLKIPPRPSSRPKFCPSSQLPIRQESKVPVQPPNFQSCGLSAQVDELLELITPSEASERVANELAEYTQSIIQEMLSGASVSGYANADVLRGTAFGVAVPEIDLVVTADPDSLERQLQGRLAKGGIPKTRMDSRKMQKSAIRACTDLLVAAGGFKFRRSAFRCEEPKVTLMGPSTMSVSGQGIPVDFSVNCATPGCHAALIAACGEIDERSRGLILLVRRWSKDRGVCHVARGHLPPYGWTLLAIFYLQAQEKLLPPMSGLKSGARYEVQKRQVPGRLNDCTVGSFFAGFVGFYQQIDLQQEVVSLRRGVRQESQQMQTLLGSIRGWNPTIARRTRASRSDSFRRGKGSFGRSP
ncbi:unnamed protein product, partial [Effrenium voratum]